jgi:hypothetical protein
MSVALKVDGAPGESLADWSGAELPPPDNPSAVGERPYYATDKRRTDVFVALTITKIREIDPKRSSVSLRGFLAMQWDTGIVRRHLDEAALWTPTLAFLNNDELTVDKSPATYFPESGWAKMMVTFDGHCSQEYNLRTFPWDFNHYALMLVVDMGTKGGNKLTRLFWQENRNIVLSTPLYLDKQLTEYDLVEELNALSRLPFRTDGGNQLWGRYNTIHFRFHLKRNTWYYLTKICMVVLFLNIISWGVFFMHNPLPPPNDDEAAFVSPSPSSSGVGRRRLKTSTKGSGVNPAENAGDYYFHIGVERFAERLSTIAEILLACVAFQYLTDEGKWGKRAPFPSGFLLLL